MANHKKVLICDTDSENMQGIISALQQEGYEVATLTDATQLVSRAVQRKYAVVVVNPETHGFDGDAICASLKQEAGVPVLLLLEPDSNARNTIGQCAADDVVTKPIDLGNFVNLLNKHFTLSRAVE